MSEPTSKDPVSDEQPAEPTAAAPDAPVVDAADPEGDGLTTGQTTASVHGDVLDI